MLVLRYIHSTNLSLKVGCVLIFQVQEGLNLQLKNLQKLFFRVHIDSIPNAQYRYESSDV